MHAARSRTPTDPEALVDTARYVVAVLLVVTMPPALAWWVALHPFVGFWRRVGTRATLWILGVAMVAGVALLFLARHLLVGPDLGTSWPRVALAAALGAGALVIGLARRGHLTFRVLSGVPELESEGRPESLLTQGPYAVVRHPRYVEVVLGAFAYALFANYVGTYVVAALTVPALHAIVLMEERELAERFGRAWEDYRARVPRYLPRLTR